VDLTRSGILHRPEGEGVTQVILYRVAVWASDLLFRLAALPHITLFRISSARSLIEKDLDRWMDIVRLTSPVRNSRWSALTRLLVTYPEYRNLFYYRVREACGRQIGCRLLLILARLLYKPMETLFITTPSIGPGLFIQHGFSTIIAARSLGENCWVNQQVTIGFTSDTDCPVLEDNVTVTAGAKVLGGITVGRNSVVGANAVVVKNVPPDCTVVGVPAYIIKRDGRKIREPL
jgi:serine O-acetyltransferase